MAIELHQIMEDINMSDEQEFKIEDLLPGKFKVTAGGGDYKMLEDGQMLRANVGKIGTVDTMNFEGTEKVKKLVVPFVEQETGQKYTKWLTPSLHPKSAMAPIVAAILGEVPAEFDPVDLQGKPVQIVLKNYEKDGVTRQTIAGVFKPAKDQKAVEIKDETVVEDFDVDAALAEAGVE